jgi:N-acetylneuraminate synthase
MSKVIIIAEAGVNHNGDINLAMRLIEEAARAGADYVKFQTFKAQNLVAGNAPKADYQKAAQSTPEAETQLEMLQKLELSPNDHLKLIEHCKLKNIKFLSTGFDLDSLDMLNELDMDFFKIPSGEITNLPLLERIAGFKKPVVLSTGMSTLQEIGSAIQVLINKGVNKEELTVLHCTTEYPAPFDEVNLNAMLTIRDTFGVNAGYSDHTTGIEIPVAAVAMGAKIIEKHFTLDRSLPGPDHKASLEPDELTEMVRMIRNVEKALGNGLKEPSASERKNIIIARKSIHIVSDLTKGHIIDASDLIMKRPGDGISPMLLNNVIGMKLNVDIKAGSKLNWEQLI